MSNPWDDFLAGFDEPAPEERRAPDEDPIFEQLDALHDECRERGDYRWFPPGPDPQGLERLVEKWRPRWRARSTLSCERTPLASASSR